MRLPLWLAAAGLNYNINRLRIDARDWLRQIVNVCCVRERPAPTLEPAARWELRDVVLAEIGQAGPALIAADQVNPWGPVPGIVDALERLESDIDPDLGFRLLLRAMKALWILVDQAQLARYEAIGERFSFNEAVVYDGEFTFVSAEC
ncbi:hypothetical protein ACFYMW_39285 [Streptomyces sp. NPDC006692]|uniref:hypothetical protein n=1 Tax=Streptomyces sp. NPDC006692 TaxID=3364758 RepID=UPI0036A0DB89